MGRYGFTSPGGMAGNAIQEFLMQREMLARQQQMDALARQREEHDVRQHDEQMTLQRQQEARIAAAQAQAQKDLEAEREFRRAGTIAENALPGDQVDDPTREMLTKQGYGSQIAQVPGVLMQGPLQEGEERPSSPDSYQMRGGSKYLSARATADERAAQAEAAQAAREEEAERNRLFRGEQADRDRALRVDMAGVANAGKAETTGLRNDLLQTQVDAAKEKATEKAASDKRARDAARVTSGATIDVLKELADFDDKGRATLKPGTANLFGARNPLARLVPGGDTNNAKAALDRLKGRVIVDLLNEMKNQSRTGATGFGALSGPELELLQNAASELNSSFIGDDRAAQELERIYSVARQLYGDAPNGGGSFRVIRKH